MKTLIDSEGKTAADRIHAAMTGKEWSPDTLEEIAQILVQYGYTIEEPGVE